jgi:hypothetical protein
VNSPYFKVQPDDGTPRHVPDSTVVFTVTQARDLFFSIGILRTTRRCRISSLIAASPTLWRAAYVTERMGRAGRKMLQLPAFLRSISCSRWPTSKAAHGRPRSRIEYRRS